MAPKTKQQFEGMRSEKRDVILETALEVFATHGYHGASISTIAQHAGIAKGLLYNYFESKEELLKAILQKGVQDMLAIFMPHVEAELNKELFRELLHLYFKTLEENNSFWRLYFAIAMQPSVMEMIANEFEPLVSPYMELLQKYYKLQGSKNPEADALLAHALLDGITMNFLMIHHDFDLEKIKILAINKLENPNF